MRFHVSENVNSTALYQAARKAGVDIEYSRHGSRKSHHAFEVKLFGNSKRRPNFWSGVNSEYAATWDQWGVFIAALYEIDENMSSYAYWGASDFHWKTDGRFDGMPEDMHGDHVFRFAGIPFSQQCNKCSAVRRWK